MRKIRVGLIGANAEYGWGKTAHVPAIQAVDALTLAAIATSRLETASKAAEAFGASMAFGDYREMVAHPEIDLVAVAVRAPMHMDIVAAALAAGKHVYCEWPLGNGLAQTLRLNEMAEAAATCCAIGLQGRVSPWIRQVRELVASGYVGRVLSTTMVASDDFSTGRVAASNVYMLDVANGANPLTIHFGHFADVMCFVLGEVESVSAQLATSWPDVTVVESGKTVSATSADQIAVAAILKGGAVASIHIRAGRSPHDTLLWEIQGDQGFLRITLEGGYLHWRPLKIEGVQGAASALTQLPPPAAEHFGIPGVSEGPHQNVAYAYAALASDINSHTRLSATFADAVLRHRLLDAIETSARRGVRPA
jgi:predicted dehydrogenase